MSWKRLIALFAVLAMLAGACGGGDDDDGDTSAGDDMADDDGGDAGDDGDDGGDDGGDDAGDDGGDDGGDDAPASDAGNGGELLLLQWQAPSQANPYLSSGSKDLLAGSLVLEYNVTIAGAAADVTKAAASKEALTKAWGTKEAAAEPARLLVQPTPSAQLATGNSAATPP